MHETQVLTDTEQDQLQVIALLVKQLGGKAVISDNEMRGHDTHLTLTQHYDDIEGIVFEVRED